MLPLFNSNSFLTNSERRVLSSLESQPLQSRIKQLLQTKKAEQIKIVQLVLEVILKTKASDRREKFLVNVLCEPNSETIKKILRIIQQGVFEDFIYNVDRKRTKNLSSQEINESLNIFNKKLPTDLASITSSIESSNAVSTVAFDAFQKIQNCRYYHQLSKLVESYGQYACLAQGYPLNHFRQNFVILFENLNTLNQFEENEKAEIVKIIIRLIHNAKAVQYTLVDLHELLMQAELLKKNAGEEVLDFFFTSAKQSPSISIEEFLRALQLLNLSCHDIHFYSIFGQWQSGSFAMLFELLESYLVQTGLDASLFEEDIDVRIKRFTFDSTVTKPLCQSDIELIAFQYLKVQNYCYEYQCLTFHQLINKAHLLRDQAAITPLSEDENMQLIAIGRLVIRLTFGIYPYSTQVLALLGLLIGGESRQAQVKTGEGKSTIVALWSFIHAMNCRAIDIITSSRYLSKRDQQKFASFFERCGITTSHICYDKKKPHHFKAQILYGPAFDFEFAWMGDHLWDEKLFAERLKAPYVTCNFDMVCIDESDNLLIDTARNGARLAFPAEVSYDWIYAPILLFAKNYFQEKYDASENCIYNLKEFIYKRVSPANQKLLRQIPDKQMLKWLFSARDALSKKVNVDYVIIRNKEETNVKHKIQIIDTITQRISEKSRWSEGIHEFLEVKHDITVEKESVNPISLSHAVFYKFYKTINALTGTAEDVQTAKIYRITTFHVPPHRPSIRKDLPPIYANNAHEHNKLIVQTVKDLIHVRRPLLIVCATIQDSMFLEKLMQDNNILCELLNELQNSSEESIVEHAGKPGKITIATSIAGRGTDIILHPESLSNGGLHVLMTFFPDSEREEQQVKGRAGRQGQPGSSQMILNREDPKIKQAVPVDLFVQQNDQMNALLLKNQLLSLGIDEMPFLKATRTNREERQNIASLQRAEFEHYFAGNTHPFFAKYCIWFTQVNDEKFLSTHSQRLCQKGITKEKAASIDFTHLNKDLDLAEEFKRLLSTKHNEIPWKVFLKALTQSISQQVIVAWAIDCFQPIENMINSELKLSGELKIKIEALLASYFSQWEKYLEADGSGIFIYLQELTTLNYNPSNKGKLLLK